jgi:hypothetical protein
MKGEVEYMADESSQVLCIDMMRAPHLRIFFFLSIDLYPSVCSSVGTPSCYL